MNQPITARQFSVSEIITLIGRDCWDMQYFLPIQNEVTDRINTKLRGEDVQLQGDNEEYILRRCIEKATGDDRETAQMIKYAGITPHVADKIELGAIMVSSWGYEQTNVDFYCVVEMTAAMVKLLPLKKQSRVDEGCCSMAGKTAATKEIDFRTVVLRKKKKAGNWVKIESYAHASLWNGKAKYESWYA